METRYAEHLPKSLKIGWTPYALHSLEYTQSWVLAQFLQRSCMISPFVNYPQSSPVSVGRPCFANEQHQDLIACRKQYSNDSDLYAPEFGMIFGTNGLLGLQLRVDRHLMPKLFSKFTGFMVQILDCVLNML